MKISIALIVGISLGLLFIFGYIFISLQLQKEKDKKRFTDPYKIKGSVNTEDQLPKTGNTYGDVYKVLEPYPEYYVWCEGDSWRHIK